MLAIMCLQATLAKKGKNKKKQEQAPEWAPKSNPGKSERLQSEFLGESIKLDCQAKGKPSPKVTWFKDGQKLEKGNGRLTIKKHRLTINSLAVEDKGNYTCSVSNSKGQIEWTFYVDVLVKIWPLVIQGPENITATVGQTVQFHCRVLNDPSATVRWQRKPNTELMESTGRQEFLNTSVNPEILELTNVLPEHAGEYRCAVGNIWGLKYSSGFLTVLRPTTIETTTTPTTTTTTTPTTTTTTATTTTEIPTTLFVPHSSELDIFDADTFETTHQSRRNNNDRRKNPRRRKPPKSKVTTFAPFITSTYLPPSEVTKIWNHQEDDWTPAEVEEPLPEDNDQQDSVGGWISLWTIYTIVGAVGGVILLIGLLAITIAICCRRDGGGSYKSTPV
ncbi:hypothetical protein C0Q70_08820 [Pomacea canaliculata]|uniref:receptor protein-tyrosine kinase n=2 Tax=Pomacea canaliculata TaxID=400727 RepID=A0A2T7P848_POMCA|nr:hypothetical protein C0Q70_08820 [Pomacea canaliculata]